MATRAKKKTEHALDRYVAFLPPMAWRHMQHISKRDHLITLLIHNDVPSPVRASCDAHAPTEVISMKDIVATPSPHHTYSCPSAEGPRGKGRRRGKEGEKDPG